MRDNRVYKFNQLSYGIPFRGGVLLSRLSYKFFLAADCFIVFLFDHRTRNIRLHRSPDSTT